MLQPLNSHSRNHHDLKATKEYLAIKYNNTCFLNIHQVDLGAAYYDWKFTAIGILRDLVEEEQCNIVIHSNWRTYQTFEKLKALFQIYGLEDSIIGVTEEGDKAASIKKYLSKHEAIDNYVVIDDDKTLLHDFGSNFCLTNNFLTTSDYNRCKTILNHKISISLEDSIIHCYVNGKIECRFLFLDVDAEGLNVWILSLAENEKYKKTALYQCLIYELIKFLSINQSELSGIILLEHDFKGIIGLYDTFSKYEESAQAYYLPIRQGGCPEEMNYRWEAIETILKLYDKAK